jgi:putative FmdB family regulatory protein
MPIYEYVCSSCAVRFEKLVQRWGDSVSCPACRSGEVEKQLSSFAVGTAAPSSSPFGGCGRGDGDCGAPACGGGGCGLPS